MIAFQNISIFLLFNKRKHQVWQSCCFFIFYFLLNSSCQFFQREIALTEGLKITRSVTILPAVYLLNGTDSLEKGALTIEGNNITVDFQGAILQGSNDQHFPNEFYGTGILIKGKNIEIKNAIVKGFKIAVMAEGVENLKILDSDFSYNFRQRLKSTREKENLDDWMSYHNNENDEWLRYGAAMYFKKCNNALVKNTKVTQGQNGLMLVECDNGLFYNNDFSFNSGIGIGLYRSSFNRVMHNKCDWNIRGYSHGIYNRGQDSAGILAYESCHNNVFAYNSATHSGDGFFLWAGQTFMDSGEGGCNDNMIFSNDFSHASNNAVEVTFSSNKILKNRLEDSDYGVWGGYSYGTQIIGNQFNKNNHGIAFEHGHDNEISYNIFKNEKIGVQLWEREKQPESWGFVKNKKIKSRNYFLQYNTFISVENPLQISKTQDLDIQLNHFYNFENLLLQKSKNESFLFAQNKIYQNSGLGSARSFFRKGNILENQILPQTDFLAERAGAFHTALVDSLYVYSNQFPLKKNNTSTNLLLEKLSVPSPLPDGMNALLPEKHFRGKKYMIVNEWGPYNFEYPLIWLREINTPKKSKQAKYTFAIFGGEGNWKIVNAKGFQQSSRQSGSVPATIVVTKSNNATDDFFIELEFIGNEFRNQFGKVHPKGKTYKFSYGARN